MLIIYLILRRNNFKSKFSLKTFINVPINVNIILLVTYAMSMMSNDDTIARGMLLFGFVASSPVVAIMSNPMKA